MVKLNLTASGEKNFFPPKSNPALIRKRVCLNAIRINITVLLFFYVNCLPAQTDTLVFYPVNNTLLQQCDIRTINITSDGKLWLSTNQGIVSYDGNNVSIFSENSIFNSIGNQKDDLYLIEMHGIYHFDARTGIDKYLDISVDPENASLDPRTYTDVYADKDGSIWCARTNGFLHYNLQSKKTVFFPVYNSNKKRIAVTSIEGDKKDTEILWLGTDNGIFTFNKKTLNLQCHFKPGNPRDPVTSAIRVSKMHVTLTDTIWFTGDKRGIGSYDIKKGEYSIYPCKKRGSNSGTDINLTFLQAKNNDEYYVGSTDNCPGVFNIRTHQYTFKSKTYKELPALNINQFKADSTGNIWCVIFGQLYYASANANKFVTVPLRDIDYKSQVRNVFKTVIWDTIRKCYYAAFDNSDVIFVLDSNMKAVKSIPIQNPGNEAGQSREPDTYDISLDNSSRLWACGTSLSVYDSVEHRLVPAHKLYKGLFFPYQRFQNIICRGNYLYLQPSNPAYKAIYKVDLSLFTYDTIPVPYEMIPPGYENSWNKGEYQDVAVIDQQGKYAYIGIDNYIVQVNLLTKKGRKITRVTLRDNGYYFNMFWYALDDNGSLWVTSSEGIKIINPESLKTTKKINQGYETIRYQLYNADGRGIMCLLYSGGIILYDYRNNKEYHLSLSDGLITLFNSGIACVNNMLFAGAELDALQYIRLNSVINQNAERKCYLTNIEIFNKPYLADTLPQYLHVLQLPHDQNFITLTFSSTAFEQPEGLEYRYRMNGINKDWIYTNYLNRTISYNELRPGNYIFYTAIKNADGSWNDNSINLEIIIIPAWWQTSWCRLACILAICCLVVWLARRRITAVRKKEQQKAKIEKEILELEARALRAQMNPHFIFNCLNSIKSLIQQHYEDKAVNYLTTFSKLIRTLFNNADRKEISLFDEIETCRLYLQLETMRFDAKFVWSVSMDENVDLKSIAVPALIIQPFIENAIWHGIIPRNNGGHISLMVNKKFEFIEIIIEDDGIGREASQQNKADSGLIHQSRGVNLTQSRLKLDNLLQQRQASIETIDKQDQYGKAAGTKVIIKIKEEV